MISKIIPCCRNYLNPNEILYLRVKNESPYYIYTVLEYLVNGRTTKRQSPVFPPGKESCLTFSSHATNAFFRIFSSFHNPPAIVCLQSISTNVSSCYKVVGSTYVELQCIQAPC